MNEETNNIISFAEFEFDTARRRLRRGGETVALHAKAFDLLSFLVSNNGRVVSKDEILDTVWEGQFVEESNLVVQISNLRKALGETKNEPRFLITVPGKGYKFTAETNGNGFLIETHTVSELTIEEEIQDEKPALTANKSTNWKWLAFAATVILAIGGIGYWRYQQPDKQNNLAFGWTKPERMIQLRQLTAHGKIENAAISPDGTLYAYTDEGRETAGLWVAGINGSQTLEVVPPSVYSFAGLTFSPDGLQIYYPAHDEKNQVTALFRVPTFGGLPEKVLSNVCCPITFSADGKQFAFMRRFPDRKLSAIIVANVQGNADEKEIATRPLETGFGGNGGSWSPDGKKIAIGGIDEITKDHAVFLVDVNSGNVEKFGDKTYNFVRRVQWMPDGSGLLINVIEKESWHERQIWMLDYPSGKAHKITTDLNRYGKDTAGISADGTKLLGVGAKTISNIFVGQADNLENLKSITNNSVGKNDGGFNSLTWTPDGRLVFTRFFDKSDTLWIMNADGTNARQLTPSGSLDRKPTVTSDGRYVVFQSARKGFWNVWRVDLDGSNLKQLTFDTETLVGALGVSVSLTPDGKQVFYMRKNFIWKVPIDGGEPVQMTYKPSRAVEVSPDGKMFACFYRPAKDDKLKLAVFPIEGGEPLHLFDAMADLQGDKLRWTLDSQAIVYAFYNSTAWKQKLSGGAPEKFLEFPDQLINAFAWSFDGKQFAVAHGQEPRDVVLFTIER